MSSGGDELASRVAEQLGWQQVSRDLINQAALAAGAPQVALAEIDEFGFFGLRPSAKEWQAYQTQIAHFIRQLAEQGNVVIVGRGGQMVLKGYPDVLHIRVVASLEYRINRLKQQRNVSIESAQACLERSDKTRRRFLRRSHGVNLNDPVLYHLILNTSLLSLPQAIKIIIRAIQEWPDNN